MKTHPISKNLRSLSCALIGLLASSQLCHAANYQWDVNGAAANLGGTGTWNATNAFWDDLSTGLNDGTDPTQAVTFSASHTATFAGTAGTVTFGATVTTGAMTLTSANYLFKGLGNGTQNFNGLTTLPITGTTSYNQTGNSNAFKFNGGVNLNGSAISINLRNTLNGGSPSTATGKITGNGTLTVTNELTGTNNTARLVLSGNNDYTGSTVVDGAILDINSATALGTSTLTINNTVSGISTVIRNTSAGALTISNNNAMNWNGDFTFNAGSARAGSSSGLTNLRDLNMGTGAVTLGGNRNVTVSANTLTVGGVIDDGVNDYSLTKAGAGSLFLDGINTYTGDTNITDGTLSILESYLADSSSVSISGTGVFDLSFAGTDTVDKLFINGVQQTTGTWGSTTSGATHINDTHINDTHFTGTGKLSVTTAPDPLIVVASTVTATTNSAAAALSIPVSNNGATQTLNISAITIGGANASSFVINSNLPLTIAPGGSSTINYTFTPTTGPGAYTATFDIVSNDLTQSPKTVTLNLTDNPDPWIVASNASFANDGLAAAYTVSVANTGNANSLTLGSVTAGGVDAGTVTGITAPSSILPGETGDIRFTFTPDLGAGPYNFTLTIPSNDPGTPSKVIAVTITVTDPVIAVSTNAINYGIYTHAPVPQVQTVTVTNQGGTQNLTISGTTITGAPEFTVTSTPGPIAPGASAPVEITFTPGSGFGRFNGTLQIASNDSIGSTPSINLTAFVEPSGTVAARFDFAPNSVSGSVVDIDTTTLAAVVLGSLTDMATGLGALSTSNQGASNRALATGVNGNYLNFSCAREADAQTPVAAGGSNETTWTTVSVAPQPGGGQINFTGGAAVIDTYANTDQSNNTAANWALYYSTDSGSTWTIIGAALAGQSTTTNGTKGPLGLTWDLSVIGNQTAPVLFALDAVATGGTNGVVTQRGVGFDNLVITAGSITPGTTGANFASWASGFSIPNDPTYDAGDNDGLGALVEYALGLSPLVSETLANTYNPATRVLSFTKGSEAVTNGDVTYAIETSPNLLNPWTPVSYVLPDVNDGTTISYTLPTGLGKIFARLVVTQIP
jgi:autotransporter-associated beta strand protein